MIKEQARMKIFKVISYGSIVAGFILLIIMGYMAFFPINPVQYLDDRFEVNPLEVRSGGFINIHLRYNKFIDSPAHIKVSFVDTIITDAINYTSLRKAGYYDHWRKISVPKTLAPGRYYLIFSVKFDINPLRTEQRSTRSIYFDVIE